MQSLIGRCCFSNPFNNKDFSIDTEVKRKLFLSPVELNISCNWDNGRERYAIPRRKKELD
jgi:hypothetical protein